MMEIKEIYNNSNGREFISKDYLRSKVIDYMNFCALDIPRMAQNNSCILQDTFSSLNGMVVGYIHLDLLTKNEVDLFINAVITTMYNEKEFVAYMYLYGAVSLKYVGKLED